MTIFKTFLKILYACRIPIIIYSVILIVFGGLNMQTKDSNTNFVASKPDILIVNKDANEGITHSLILYIKSKSNSVDIKMNTKAINDALFYRDVNYIIFIPKHFNEEFLNGENPKLEIKSTGDYQASLADMMLKRYISVANSYVSVFSSTEEIIANINHTLDISTEVKMTSKIDTDNLSKLAYYYNFASYSILAGCVYVICLILSSFKSTKISKRTIISSMNYKEYNRKLLLSNGLFAFVLWLFYVLLSIVFVGKIVFSVHGMLYLLNSFIFTICAVSIAFLIGTAINNKNAINGIVNVVALGSSFLCGAFVPMEMLPENVLNIAHILPTFWFIKSNEALKVLENINRSTLKPILTNMFIMLVFMVLFVIVTNMISNQKRKLD